MSHIFKSGTSVFTTGGSIIRVKDTITFSKQPIDLGGFHWPQFIEFDVVTKRYYVATTNTIKIFDSNFSFIDSITSIGGIVSMQMDAANNRLIITEKNTPSFSAVDLTTHTVTFLFSPSGITEQMRCGYYDATGNKFYVGTNQIYVYSNTGGFVGMITDGRMNASNVVFLIVNPYTGMLMISIPGGILLADTNTMLVQAGKISGYGVEAPVFIRFDPINPNSYWVSNTSMGYFTEMSVGTNGVKRVVQLVNSTPFSLWVEYRLGLYSIIVTDAGWDKFYRLKEELV